MASPRKEKDMQLPTSQYHHEYDENGMGNNKEYYGRGVGRPKKAKRETEELPKSKRARKAFKMGKRKNSVKCSKCGIRGKIGFQLCGFNRCASEMPHITYRTRKTILDLIFNKNEAMNWTRSTTKMMVDLFVNEKRAGREWTEQQFFTSVVEYLNAETGQTYTANDVNKRLDALRCRWNLFQSIFTIVGVNWDRATNRMDIPLRMWPALIERNPMSVAYLRHGEPWWEELTILFGHEGQVTATGGEPDVPCGVQPTQPEDVPYLSTDDELAGENDYHRYPSSEEEGSGNYV